MRQVAFLAAVVGACTSAPELSDHPSTSPTKTVVALVSPSPTLSPSPASVPLQIAGKGDFSCTEWSDGCRPVLLIEPAPARSLFALGVDDVDVTFGGAWRGPVSPEASGAPETLAPGSWAVAVGTVESSDVGSCNNPCTSPFFPSWLNINCVTQFEISPTSTRVTMTADFGPPCAIDVDIQPPAGGPAEPIAVPAWMPPQGGILDDCSYRQSLLRIDPDGRPWYEEIKTGRRIETLEYEGWQAVFGHRARLVAPEGGEVTEWTISDVHCVFSASGVQWVGGSYAAWAAWDEILGEQPGQMARMIFSIERGNDGGPPPGAVTLTDARYESVGRSLLRELDDEIRHGGDRRWSANYADFFLGDDAALFQETDAVGAAGFPGADWIIWRDPRMHFRAQLVRVLKTPAGKSVTAVDQTLFALDDCASLVLPDAAPVDPRIDRQAGLVTAYFDDPAEGRTLVAVDYADPTCESQPVMGPLIDQLLAGG
jgi:hypothetical protein